MGRFLGGCKWLVWGGLWGFAQVWGLDTLMCGKGLTRIVKDHRLGVLVGGPFPSAVSFEPLVKANTKFLRFYKLRARMMAG
jgi:hypothetical protein